MLLIVVDWDSIEFDKVFGIINKVFVVFVWEDDERGVVIDEDVVGAKGLGNIVHLFVLKQLHGALQ